MLANTVVEPHAVGGIWSLLPETKRPHKIIHRPRSKQEVYDATLLGSRKFSYDGTIMFPEGYGLGKRICRKLLGPVDQRELARGVYRATSLQFLLDYEMSPGLPRMNDEIFLSNLGEGTYRPHFLALHQDNGKLRFWLRPNTSLSNSKEYYGGRVRTFRIE